MEITEPTYNGWKNRTTWAIALWLHNDYELYKELVSARLDAAEMEAFVRNNWHSFETSMRTDIGASLSRVDWDAVAESFVEDGE